jgi:hypothetical protein
VSEIDIGEYCRQVEDYLTRVNGGHLVRIVGPGFEVVRRWAMEGIPLRIVCRGIDHRVERHQAGSSQRPLRIEFCDADVREVYRNWHRAVGLTTGSTGTMPADELPSLPDEHSGSAEKRRPSLAKHLDRALDRLGRVTGRLELPESLRDGLSGIMTELAAMREQAKGARGPDRDHYVAKLAAMDIELLNLARSCSAEEFVTTARRDAEQDLSSYRVRLSGDAWTKALNATSDQLLRDRLGLPQLEL